MASLSRIVAMPDLTEPVYPRLLYAICDGELASGVRLTQEGLAATLGVSRQPVLQALRLLTKEDCVSDAGRRSLRVGPLEAQAITQLDPRVCVRGVGLLSGSVSGQGSLLSGHGTTGSTRLRAIRSPFASIPAKTSSTFRMNRAAA